MNEFELIARLTAGLPGSATTVVGAGDDCAVLDFGLADRWVLFKTDAVVEGVHFKKDAPPRGVGHKALARCLSDIAAMAGNPTHAVITLALPPTFEVGVVEQIYEGLKALAALHQVAIVGGETTMHPGGLLISVAALGTVPKNRCPLRAGARAGDGLFVTGELGGALWGKHLEFQPRLAEARWLTEHFDIHAMIDLSDGLAGDLPHILQASRVGAELVAEALPVSLAAKRAARSSTAAKPPLLAALTDGEDFELLFTLARGDAVPLLDAWKSQFPALRLSCIGQITPGPGLALRDRRGSRPLAAHGYVHFQKP
jgi:thiamine-monophosphate kinase